jgi:hypothetical protein
MSLVYLTTEEVKGDFEIKKWRVVCLQVPITCYDRFKQGTIQNIRLSLVYHFFLNTDMKSF